jgi:hypothetical protein
MALPAQGFDFHQAMKQKVPDLFSEKDISLIGNK